LNAPASGMSVGFSRSHFRIFAGRFALKHLLSSLWIDPCEALLSVAVNRF